MDIKYLLHFRYYLATREHTNQEYRPGQRHLYVARDPASSEDPRKSEPQCITCDLSDFLWSSRYYYDDVNCTHFNALVSIRKLVVDKFFSIR